MESDIHPSDKRIIQFMQLLRLYSFLTRCNWSHTDIADISLYSFPNIVSSFRRRLNDWNLVSLQNMQCYNSVQVSNENLSGPNVTRQGNRESATRYAKPVRCMLDFYTAVCEMATVNDTHCLLMYMSVLWSPCFHLSLLQTYPPFSMMIPWSLLRGARWEVVPEVTPNNNLSLFCWICAGSFISIFVTITHAFRFQQLVIRIPPIMPLPPSLPGLPDDYTPQVSPFSSSPALLLPQRSAERRWFSSTLGTI